MSRTVFLSGLHPETRRDDIEYEFGRFGQLSYVVLGRSRRGKIAYVEYTDERDAKDAVRELQGLRILGKVIDIRIRDPKTQQYAKEDGEDEETLVLSPRFARLQGVLNGIKWSEIRVLSEEDFVASFVPSKRLLARLCFRSLCDKYHKEVVSSMCRSSNERVK